MKPRLFILSAVCLLFVLLPVLAADWPQWRGPDRDGVSKEKGLLSAWSEKGPPLMWTYDKFGLGFSSPAVVGDRLYTMGARKDKTYLIALDIKGMPTEKWAFEVGDMFTFMGNVWGDGPRCTPTVDGEYIYALGGFGDLVCVEAKSGKPKWKKNLEKDLNGEMMSEWGYSESVLIDGDKLICTPGGKNGTLAALDKKTGNVIWRSTDLKDAATYSSVMATEIHGVKQYVAMTYIDKIKGGAVAGVAAKDGKLLWYQPFFTGHSYSVAPTPIIKGDEVYITAGYGAGCQLLKIKNEGGKFSVEKEYDRKTQKLVKSTHGGVVLVGDHLYGHSDKSRWVCQNWKTGKLAWEERFKLDCDSGSLMAADGHLYLYSDEGTCVLLKASPEGWDEKGRFTIPKKSDAPEKLATFQSSRIWTHPIIANGKLYLRDQEYLFCYDIKWK